jgi:hypothetical protein
MPSNESYTLEYMPKTGETLRYDINVTSEQVVTEKGTSTEQAFIVHMILAQKVTEVEGKEHFTSEYLMEWGEMMQDGVSLPLPGVGEWYTMKMKMNGEVIDSTIDLPYSSPAFPEIEIHQGYHWSQKSPLTLPPGITPGDGKEPTLDYDYEIEGFEEKLGYRCTAIAVKCPEKTYTFEPDVEQTTSGEGRVFFAHSEGKLVSFHNSTISEISTQALTMSLTAKTSMELLS